MIATLLVGVAAGVLAGLLGIGGGALFVPALVLILGLSQVDAEATSLLAIIPVAAVGAWRQRAYGNVRVREGVTIGLIAVPAAVVGVVVLNAVPERAIELAFAVLLVWVAWTLAGPAWRELRGGEPLPGRADGAGPGA